MPNNSFSGCRDPPYDVHPDARDVPDANTGDGQPNIAGSQIDHTTSRYGSTGLEKTSHTLFIKLSGTPAKDIQTDAPIHPGQDEWTTQKRTTQDKANKVIFEKNSHEDQSQESCGSHSQDSSRDQSQEELED